MKLILAFRNFADVPKNDSSDESVGCEGDIAAANGEQKDGQSWFVGDNDCTFNFTCIIIMESALFSGDSG